MIGCSMAAATALMTVGWLSVRSGKLPIGSVDLLWVLCIWGTSAISFAGGSQSVAAITLLAMISLWAVRLGFLLLRRFRSFAEDRRYANLRQKWGGTVGWRFLILFQAQGLFAVFLVCLLAPAFSTAFLVPATLIAAVGVYALGVLGTAVADWQLAAFKATGSAGLCRRGLWRWARHPNYFFEMLTWSGMGLVPLACQSGWSGPFAAVLLSASICWLTGVPPKERLASARYGPAYDTYRTETNRFLPWPTANQQRDVR